MAPRRPIVQSLAGLRRRQGQELDPSGSPVASFAKMNAIEGTRQFFDRVARADKELREYEGGYHVLQWDTNAQQVLAAIDEWLRRHIAAVAPEAAGPPVS